MSEEDIHARHAPRAREERHPLDLEPRFIFGFFETWADLEAKIEQLQATKKDMLDKVRRDYGRHQAESLRIAMRLALMEADARAEHKIFNAMAHRYADLIAGAYDLQEAA